MAHAGRAGELLFELGHLRPHDEPAVLEDARDRGLDSSAEPPALRLEIDEGKRRRRGAGRVWSGRY
jgi:hypothetical protein